MPRRRLAEARNHRDMMLHPDAWPRWPLLPIKQYPSDGRLKVGLLVACTGHSKKDGKVVFIENGNLFTFNAELDMNRAKIVSVDDLLKAGWIVD